MRKIVSLLVLLILLCPLHSNPAAAPAQRPVEAQYTKTTLLSDGEIKALAAEISGLVAKDTVVELSRHHRVQASSGFSNAAQFIASKAKEYGLEQVEIERYPADGEKTYYTLKSTPGWEVERGQLWETEPGKTKLADYDEMRVALADYSQSADVTTSLVQCRRGHGRARLRRQRRKGAHSACGRQRRHRAPDGLQ